MIWINRRPWTMISKCLGALIFLLAIPNPLYSQSFDCRLAKHADERTICSDAILAELDHTVSVLYALRGKDRSAVSNQRSWLTMRGRCGEDVACLRKIYLKRIDELAQDLPKSSPAVAGAEIYDYSCKLNGKTYPLRVETNANSLEWRGSKYRISDANTNDVVCARAGWHVEWNGMVFDFCTATQGYADFEEDGVKVQCEMCNPCISRSRDPVASHSNQCTECTDSYSHGCSDAYSAGFPLTVEVGFSPAASFRIRDRIGASSAYKMQCHLDQPTPKKSSSFCCRTLQNRFLSLGP